MKTVVITLNWNGDIPTIQMLQSFKDVAFPYDVWVVDNGSTRTDDLAIKAVYPNVTIYHFPENLGFAGGFNKAIRMASDTGYDYVYSINNDTIAMDDFVTPCVKIMDCKPNCSIVSSRFLEKDKDGKFTQWAFHSNPSEQSSFTAGYLQTDRVLGGGMLIRCRDYHAIGGLDERFFCYGEETDLCWRLIDSGKDVGICFDSLLKHAHLGSDINGNSSYFFVRNSTLQHKKHPKRFSFSLFIFTFYRFVKSAIYNKDLTVLSAVGEGFLHGLLSRYGKRVKAYPKLFGCGLSLFFLLAFLPYVGVFYVLKLFRRIFPRTARTYQ